MGPGPLDDPADLVVESIVAGPVPEDFSANHVPLEHSVQLAYFVGGVGPEPLLGAFGAGPDPGPDLLGGVLGEDEEGEVSVVVAGGYHGDGIRLRESRQEPERGVLAKGVGYVVVAYHLGCGRDDGETIRPDGLGQLSSALGISVGHGERSYFGRLH